MSKDAYINTKCILQNQQKKLGKEIVPVNTVVGFTGTKCIHVIVDHAQTIHLNAPKDKSTHLIGELY